MNSKTVIFHHNPKTAGSTFLHILKRQYKDRKVYQIDGIKTDEDIAMFKSLGQKDRDSFDLIMGHQALLLDSKIMGDKLVISFFREPYEQFQSSYFYLKKASHNRHQKEVSKLTLSEYLDYTIDNNLTNPQSKLLFTAHYEDVSDIDEIETKSKEAFKLIDIPCLTEQFDLSLLLLKRKLGWYKKPYYISKNKSSRDLQKKDESLKQKHRKYNTADYEIYNLANNEFNALIETQDEAGLKTFKKANAIYGACLKILNKLK